MAILAPEVQEKVELVTDVHVAYLGTAFGTYLELGHLAPPYAATVELKLAIDLYVSVGGKGNIGGVIYMYM